MRRAAFAAPTCVTWPECAECDLRVDSVSIAQRHREYQKSAPRTRNLTSTLHHVGAPTTAFQRPK